MYPPQLKLISIGNGKRGEPLAPASEAKSAIALETSMQWKEIERTKWMRNRKNECARERAKYIEGNAKNVLWRSYIVDEWNRVRPDPSVSHLAADRLPDMDPGSEWKTLNCPHSHLEFLLQLFSPLTPRRYRARGLCTWAVREKKDKNRINCECVCVCLWEKWNKSNSVNSIRFTCLAAKTFLSSFVCNLHSFHFSLPGAFCSSCNCHSN